MTGVSLSETRNLDAAYVRDLCRKHKIGPQELGEASGRSKGQASDFLRGEYKRPLPETVDVFRRGAEAIVARKDRRDSATKLTPDAS